MKIGHTWYQKERIIFQRSIFRCFLLLVSGMTYLFISAMQVAPFLEGSDRYTWSTRDPFTIQLLRRGLVVDFGALPKTNIAAPATKWCLGNDPFWVNFGLFLRGKPPPWRWQNEGLACHRLLESWEGENLRIPRVIDPSISKTPNMNGEWKKGATFQISCRYIEKVCAKKS